MTAARWQLIEQIYHAALDRPGEQRSQFLAQTCDGDAELRAEVESLLLHDQGECPELR
jgi:eukaryotic-like serine/threonine-protein kinase